MGLVGTRTKIARGCRVRGLRRSQQGLLVEADGAQWFSVDEARLRDHEGPDPDCRRSHPTVPMTRVNPVGKSSSPFHDLVSLLPLSCRIDPEISLARARLFSPGFGQDLC